MQYNTQREPLIIPEYGRTVHKMIQHACSIQDLEERKKCVDSVIKFMGKMNPHLRDVKEFTHKLWDHLYIMSEFKINIESPYPMPEVSKLQEKPNKLEYITKTSKFSFYGSTIEEMIEIAINMSDAEKQKSLTGMIANHMKKCYLLFNKDSVDNQTISLHLEKLSNGKLSLPEGFEYINGGSITKNKKSYHKRKFKKRK
ncbi:MAG: DUF4290 domain-containing protein [Bacteroidota bacterium]|nr:DUF4290 domain-containing protein [Bacteroidota bacterium]